MVGPCTELWFWWVSKQDSGKKRKAKCMSVTNVTGLLLACFVRNSLNIDTFCSWRLAEGFFKHYYCHVCHTMFAVVFPLPPCCASSLNDWLKKSQLNDTPPPPPLLLLIFIALVFTGTYKIMYILTLNCDKSKLFIHTVVPNIFTWLLWVSFMGPVITGAFKK